MSRSFRLFVAALVLAAPAAAQSSQFGVRGLGLPMRPLSVRAAGTAGSFGLFDAESAFNPAAFALTGSLSASFQTLQSWRHSDSPSGPASVRDNRFPGVFVSGPVGGTKLALAVSVTGYTDRNFELGSVDSVTLRGARVATFDTLTSHGGVSDLRAAIAWRQSRNVQWGFGLHMLTGSNRITSHRVFSDSVYAGASEAYTFSYLGFGVSGGFVARVGKSLTFGAMARADDHLKVERDSTKFGTTKLPITLSGGVRFQFGDRALAAVSGVYRNWSVADADLIAQGGTGSLNTTEVNGGIELVTDRRRPSKYPLRFGIQRTSLPFPLRPGLTAHETGLSFGISRRFVADRAGLDLSLSRVWRKAGTEFTERATLLGIGISVRP